MWVGTVAGSSVTGKCENGYTVFASGNDENGNPVLNYVLGKGLVEILEADGTITPGADITYVHLYDEEPDQPKEGDLWPTADGYVIWQDGEEHSLGLNLTEEQNAAIDSVVDERKTTVKYVNGDVVSLDISGKITASDLTDIRNIQEIKFGTTVTAIGNNLFDSSGSSLVKVEIPDSVTSIGESAFRQCGNLTDVKFGNGLQLIDEGAFNSCGLTTVELPESLKKIYGGAFSVNANLTTVYIPKNVDYIDNTIFYLCPNAKIVFLDRILEEVVNIEAYNGIKYYPWGVDQNRIYAIDSTDSYEFCTIPPPEPYISELMYPITYSIQGVGYTVENGSELTITHNGAYYNVEHNNATLGSTILLFTADKNGVIESYGTSIDENSLLFRQQIIPPHSDSVLDVGTSYQLKNKAVNTINVSTDLLAKYDLVFPLAIGRARDFSVRVVAASGVYSDAPYLVAPSGVTLMNAEGAMPEIATDENAAKTTLVYFSEIAANTFLVKDEALETIS